MIDLSNLNSFHSGLQRRVAHLEEDDTQAVDVNLEKSNSQIFEIVEENFEMKSIWRMKNSAFWNFAYIVWYRGDV